MSVLRNLFFIAGGIAVLALSACENSNLTRVLLLDMDQYQNNTNLSVSLPGPPQGDRAENVSTAELTTIPEIPGDSLRTDGQIDFIPVTHDEPDEYNIGWDGYRAIIGTPGVTTIEFLDQNDRVGFGVEFEGASGRIRPLTADSAPIWSFNDAEGHSVTIVVNPNLNSYSFNFDQAGCTAIDTCPEANALSFADPDFGPLRRVRVLGVSYYIDDLSVLTE